jgi:beta-lactamase superfamily II metal-dependent hydrolase
VVTVFYDGLTIVGDGYKFEFFAPLKRETEYNLTDYANNTLGYATVGYGANETNENSAIFLFSCNDDYYLFTGDASFNSAEKGTNKAEDDFIESLTQTEILLIDKVDVLLLGHHGSKNSSGLDLLNLVTPSFIVISSGHEYGHPADETLERCASLAGLEPDYLLRTDEFGNIVMSSIDGKVCYSLEKENNKAYLLISYYELGTIVILFMIFVIFSIKPIRKKQG